MARNKAYDIVAFEGGLNTHADARDIEENQVAQLVNLLSTNKGVLKIGYSNATLNTSLYPTNGSNGSHGQILSRNLYEHKTDFIINNW